LTTLEARDLRTKEKKQKRVGRKFENWSQRRTEEAKGESVFGREKKQVSGKIPLCE